MDYARSTMTIIDAPLVNIEIAILSDNLESRLQLNYHGQKYDLVQAFASHKLELAQQRWQQQIAVDNVFGSPSVRVGDSLPLGTASACAERLRQRYLLVKEIGYYSLWMLDQSLNPACLIREPDRNLELQQASIWLLQEFWLQWQDFLGERQLQIFAGNLLGVNSLLKSREDLDRLLSLDPLSSEPLCNWDESNSIEFARQLCDLTQKKMGQQFGTKLTIDIIESMPDSLRTTLIDSLDLKHQSDSHPHD